MNDMNEQEEIKDPYTLMVSKETNPHNLAMYMLKTLASNDNGYVNLKSVGDPSLKNAINAYMKASSLYSEKTAGSVLVMRPTTYIANVAGNKAKGICIRVFPIPIKCAL